MRPAGSCFAAAVAVLVAACSSTQVGPARPTPPTTSSLGSITAPTGPATTPVVGGQAHLTTANWSIDVSGAGNSAVDAQLAVAPAVLTDEQANPTALSGAVLASDPVDVALTGATLDAGATVSRTLTEPIANGASAALAYYDNTYAAWRTVPSTLSADRRTVTAAVTHFTRFDIVTWVMDSVYHLTGKLLSKRVDPPSCTSSQPAWVSSTIFMDDQNAPLLWCVGEDPQHPDGLIVKVRANRDYGFALRTHAVPESVYSSFGHDANLNDLITAGVKPGALDLPAAVLGFLDKTIFVPPGTELDLGYSEAEIRKMAKDDSTLIEVSPDARWTLASLIHTAITKAYPAGSNIAYMFTMLDILSCEQNIFNANDLVSRLVEIQSCLSSQDPKAMGDRAIELVSRAQPSMTSTELSIVGVAVRKSMMMLNALMTGAQIGEILSDLINLDPASRRLSIFATSPQVIRPANSRVTVLATTNPYGTGVPTGLIVSVGEKVRFTAIGQARYGPQSAPCGGNPYTDPDGHRWLLTGQCTPKIDPAAPVPTAPIGALIVRVGTGPWFLVGRDKVITISANGPLFLGYNDPRIADNSGGYIVTLVAPAK
jgi:hypothetical protein